METVIEEDMQHTRQAMSAEYVAAAEAMAEQDQIEQDQIERDQAERDRQHLAEFDSIFRRNVALMHERLAAGESIDDIEMEMDFLENQTERDIIRG